MADLTATAQADQIERDLKRLSTIGVIASVKVARVFMAEVLAAFRKGQTRFGPQIQDLVSDVAGILTEGAVATHVSAAARVVDQMRPLIEPVQLQVYQPVIDSAQRRLSLTDEQLAPRGRISSLRGRSC